VDGTHCRIYEPRHPIHSKNPAHYSHKFKQAGLSYELALAAWESKLVWMRGPVKAGQPDMNIFSGNDGTGEACLRDKIPPGKGGIGDRG